MNNARLLLPERVAVGDVVRVRLLIQHAMETGYRQDVNGKLIARNVIRWVRCELAGAEVFRADASSGLAANPLFEFFLRVSVGGEWLVQWEDDNGTRGELRQLMALS
jgi:sulfur-oxidizing protein SoxZ